MPKREITAIAVAPDGSIYAAGLTGGVATPPAAPVPPGKPGSETPPIISGGVDVYRIDPSGLPQRLWTNPRDTVYTIAFDRAGQAILGTGNKGTLYRIDSTTLSTNLLSVTSTQITGIVVAPDGSFYAATSNVGKIFHFGPGNEATGTIESDVFDSAGFSRWGRMKAEGAGKIDLFSRSGNVDRPQENWSGWAPVQERVASPPSRFLQWKAVLSSGGQLDSVEAAYLPRNVAPRVEEIEATPPNYRFPAPNSSTPVNAPAGSITLSSPGRKSASSTVASLDPGSSSMSFAKGWIGARWIATDANADPLIFTVEIRGENEKQWRPLAEKLREKHFSFDSTAFPDGEYRLRITASDSPANVEGEALTGQAVSAPILIDNTPPQISPITLTRQGAALQASWKVIDALSVIQRTEYSLDGREWTLVEPLSKLSDALSLEYKLTLPNVSPGDHILAVRTTDEYDNQAVSKAVAN